MSLVHKHDSFKQYHWLTITENHRDTLAWSLPTMLHDNEPTPQDGVLLQVWLPASIMAALTLCTSHATRARVRMHLTSSSDDNVREEGHLLEDIRWGVAMTGDGSGIRTQSQPACAVAV